LRKEGVLVVELSIPLGEALRTKNLKKREGGIDKYGRTCTDGSYEGKDDPCGGREKNDAVQGRNDIGNPAKPERKVHANGPRRFV